MADVFKFSSRRLQISKANATIVIVVAVAAFVTVFSLVACKALLAQRSYQARVIDKKEKAKKQLKSNLEAAGKLVNTYEAFVTTPQNVLGGNPKGTGDHDGDNARIILDALPSKYDFPALTSSIEKMLTNKNFKIGGITGTDDELNQNQPQDDNSAPKVVEIPFQITVTGNYDSVKDLLSTFERSIRPFNISTIAITGGSNSMEVVLSMKTYYQPEKKVNVGTEQVK